MTTQSCSYNERLICNLRTLSAPVQVDFPHNVAVIELAKNLQLFCPRAPLTHHTGLAYTGTFSA